MGRSKSKGWVTGAGFAIALGLGITDSLGALIAEYQMGQGEPQFESSLLTADGGTLTGAAGLTGFNVDASPGGANGYASQPVLQMNTGTKQSLSNLSTASAAAFDDNEFFSFTLTIGSLVQDLDLTSITFDSAKGGGGTRGFAIRVDTPSGNDEVVNSGTTLSTVRPTFVNYSTPLSGFASLQNLTAGQVVTFEVAILASTDINSSVATPSIELDNIRINGDATVPEPATLGGLALAGLLLRRRPRLAHAARH